MKKLTYGQLSDKKGDQFNKISTKKQKIDYGEDFDTDDEDIINEHHHTDNSQVYQHTQDNSEMYIEAEMSDQDIPDEIECQLIQKTIYINRMPTTVEFIMCNQCPRLFRTENLLWNHIKASHMKRKRLYQNLIATASKILMQSKPSVSLPGTANQEDATYSSDEVHFYSEDNTNEISSHAQQSDKGVMKEIDISSLHTKMTAPQYCAPPSPVSQQSHQFSQAESQETEEEEENCPEIQINLEQCSELRQEEPAYIQEHQQPQQSILLHHQVQEQPAQIHQPQQSIQRHHQVQEQPAQIHQPQLYSPQQYIQVHQQPSQMQHPQQPQLYSPQQSIQLHNQPQEQPPQLQQYQQQPQPQSPEQIVFQFVDDEVEGEEDEVVNKDYFESSQEEEGYNYIVGLEKCETKDTTENVMSTSEDNSSDNTASDSVREFRCFRSPCTGLEAFTTEASCDQHITKVHTPKPHLQNCDICDKQFANLTKHKESVHKIFKSFTCDHCQQEYCSEQDLERHLSSIERVPTNEVVVMEDVIDLAAVEDDNVDDQQADQFLKEVQSQVFPCKECGWSTQSKTEYIQHVLHKCEQDPSPPLSKHVIVDTDGKRNHILIQQDEDMGKAVRQVLAYNNSVPQEKHILGIKKRQLGFRQFNVNQHQLSKQLKPGEEETLNTKEETIIIQNIPRSLNSEICDQQNDYSEDTNGHIDIEDSNENSSVTRKRLIHIVEDENGRELMQLVRTTGDGDNGMIHINTTHQMTN